MVYFTRFLRWETSKLRYLAWKKKLEKEQKKTLKSSSSKTSWSPARTAIPRTRLYTNSEPQGFGLFKYDLFAPAHRLQLTYPWRLQQKQNLTWTVYKTHTAQQTTHRKCLCLFHGVTNDSALRTHHLDRRGLKLWTKGHLSVWSPSHYVLYTHSNPCRAWL